MLPPNRILVILYLIFFSVSVSVTQSAEKGNYVAEFLNHGVGARALGMGSVFVSIADDATAAYWNPAGLTQVGKHAFSMMYSDTFGSGQGAFLRKGLVQYSFVNYIQRVVDIGVLGVSWIRLGIDQIPRTTFLDINSNGKLGDFQDKNGNGIKEEGELYIDRPVVAEYFSNADNALLLSLARKISPVLSVGGNLKIIRQTVFQSSGNGLGLDLGLMYQPVKNLHLGALLLDATGTQIKWTKTESSPTFTRRSTLRFGISYNLSLARFGQLRLGLDLQTGLQDTVGQGTDLAEKQQQWMPRYGSELWLFDILAVRLGQDGRNFSAGAGFRFRLGQATWLTDYAFTPHELGPSQRISVSGDF